MSRGAGMDAKICGADPGATSAPAHDAALAARRHSSWCRDVSNLGAMTCGAKPLCSNLPNVFRGLFVKKSTPKGLKYSLAAERNHPRRRSHGQRIL